MQRKFSIANGVFSSLLRKLQPVLSVADPLERRGRGDDQKQAGTPGISRQTIRLTVQEEDADQDLFM